jgi:hypothetical protein
MPSRYNPAHMRRKFELNGECVQTETRQCDVNCWELRITDAEGNVTVHYFSDPSLMDRAAMKAHRDWEDFGWLSESIDDWVSTGHSLSK